MRDNTLWVNTRNALADVYLDEVSIKRVASDSGMPLRHLVMVGSASEMWDEIMVEAERRSKLLELLQVANREYPEIDAFKIAKIVLESGGRLRESKIEVLDVRSGESSPDMTLDPRDQNEINRMRDSIHGFRDEWQIFVLQNEKRWLQLENWKSRIEEDVEEIREALSLVRSGPPLIIPARYVQVILFLVFVVAVTLGFYLLTHPNLFTRVPIPSIPGGGQ